jgi:methyl-accepting chemotaxis protein
MKNMKIGKKLITGFIIVAIITAIVGIVGIISIQTLDGEIGKMYETAEKGVLANKYRA